MVLGGPSPPSQLVPNPFNWSPKSVFYRYLSNGRSNPKKSKNEAAESWGEKDQRIAEKIKKKLCKLKTYGKKVQVEAQQKRQKEKQGTLEEMKIRKGQGGNMDSILDKKDS